MTPLHFILQAARMAAAAALVALVIKIAPTLADLAALHSGTYAAHAAVRPRKRAPPPVAAALATRSRGRSAGSSLVVPVHGRGEPWPDRWAAANRATHRARVLVPAQAPRLHAALSAAGARPPRLAAIRRPSRPTASRTSPPPVISSIGAEPADAWHDIAPRAFARRLPAAAVRALVKVHGATIACTPTRPTCPRVAESLIAHDLARSDRGPRGRFVPRAVDAARLCQLRAGRGARRDRPCRAASPGHAGRSRSRARRRRRRTLPRSTRQKASSTPFDAVLAQLALTRTCLSGLRRTGRTRRSPAGSPSRAAEGGNRRRCRPRFGACSRDVHPAFGMLVHCADWCSPLANAA